MAKGFNAEGASLPIDHLLVPGESTAISIEDIKQHSSSTNLMIPDDYDLTVTVSSPDFESSLGAQQKTKFWKALLPFKILSIFAFLYLFVCSLGFLSDSFRLLVGKAAGEFLKQDTVLQYPIVGVMIGILVTVLVQSSSTSTSIAVSMVASGLLSVKQTISIIMGSNIGTSVTNTLVGLTHVANRDDFERAFAGAVLHDMFNLLTVTTLLTVEQFTSYLEKTTELMLSSFDYHLTKTTKIKGLSVITNPFKSLIIQTDKKVLMGWSTKDPKYDNARLMKVWCNYTSSNGNSSIEVAEKCRFLFNLFDWSDTTAGLILIVMSLVMLCGCLVLLVKILSSLLKGKLALMVQKSVNANIPYVPCLTGYFAMGVGAILTVLMQSSSVFTSTMTPLIAMGMISLERAYPLTLGSNLGTTTTATLAAMATDGINMKPAIQLALCHFLFNLTGIILFYPLPPTRLPIKMAAFLGHVTAKYRWFAVFYIVFVFVLLPLFVFSLSLIGPIGFYVVLSSIIGMLLTTGTLAMLQKSCPEILPPKLRDFSFLPIWLKSLEPYDRLIMKCFEHIPSPFHRTHRDAPNNVLRGNRNSEIGFVDSGTRTPSPAPEFTNPIFKAEDPGLIFTPRKITSL